MIPYNFPSSDINLKTIFNIKTMFNISQSSNLRV